MAKAAGRPRTRSGCGTPGERAFVGKEDPALYEAVRSDRVLRAIAASAAPVVRLRRGSWLPSDEPWRAMGGFGALVLDGMLVRRVGVDGRYGAELLAKEDVLRPSEHDGQTAAVPFDTAWRVVSPVRLALLDLRWAAHMAPFPEVAAQLMGRLLLRSRRLAVLMALVQQPRLDQRLWLLFWELADRYGIVRPDGVHLQLPLTHETISHLVAAQRPSVSSALGRLTQRGLLRRSDRVWILCGQPPDTPFRDGPARR